MTLGIVISVILVAAFGVFLYKRFSAKAPADTTTGTGGSGGSGKDHNPDVKEL